MSDILATIREIAEDAIGLDDDNRYEGLARVIEALDNHRPMTTQVLVTLPDRSQVLVQGVALPYGNPRVMHRDAPNDMWSLSYTTGADPHEAERFWVGEY